MLIVASWYPGVDDTARGRFVADQAEALLRTGQTRPLVVSFEPARADLAQLSRGDGADAVDTHRAAALANGEGAINGRAWASDAAIPVARLPVGEGPGTGPSNDRQGEQRRRALRDLVERLDARGPGVVHAHTAYPDGYAAADAAERLGWPLVITEHATFVQRQLGRREQRAAYLRAVAAASRFIAVSEALADELRASVDGIANKLEVVHNAVAIEAFTPVGMDARRPEELLFVGYRRERKGIVTLLQAFADILEERPNATLRLLGRSLTDEDERRWQELAEELGVAKAVSFEPPADRAGIAAAMQRASVLVHASHRETFGITTIEALAAGLPVVAAEAGGISQILEDTRLGELVPPQDSRYLARAVLRTLERRGEFDPAYLRRAAEPYAASTIARRLVEIYAEVAPAAVRPAPERADARLVWGGESLPLPAKILVMAADTDHAAQQLARLPDDVLGRLVVVTRGAADRLPPALGEVVDATALVNDRLRAAGLHSARGGIGSRLRRLLMNPLAPIRRRLAPGGIYEVRQTAISAGLLAVADQALAATATGDGPPEMICLDAIDYRASAPLTAGGRVRPDPGSILWLADRYQSAQSAGDGTPSRSRIEEAIESPRIGQ